MCQIVLNHCIDRAVRDDEERSLTVCDCCITVKQWSSKAALTTETKQRKTIPKQIQNNVLFQALLHVKQNTETIPKRFAIVLELFQSCFRLINIFIHMSKNMQIPKQFQRSQLITDDHTCIILY